VWRPIYGTVRTPTQAAWLDFLGLRDRQVRGSGMIARSLPQQLQDWFNGKSADNQQCEDNHHDNIAGAFKTKFYRVFHNSLQAGAGNSARVNADNIRAFRGACKLLFCNPVELLYSERPNYGDNFQTLHLTRYLRRGLA
jgi:hypothetical protein